MSRAHGRVGESLAAVALTARGYHVLQANYTCRAGEIDLVCRLGDTIVFVEVRSRTRQDYGLPEETIDGKKRRRIILAAQHYLLVNQIDDVPCRFDVVAIVGDKLTIFENAFE